MRREIIGEHTVDVDRLTGGWVLDAGCRDFVFSGGMVARGCRVLALDADATVEDPKIENVTFRNVALADRTGLRALVMTEDPQARYLVDHNPQVDGARRIVAATTILNLMSECGVLHWDVIKLDIEGSEYDVLKNWPGPVATQISVEFHEHVAPRPQRVYEEIFKHLESFGYELVQHEKTARHCVSPSFWDSLWVLRKA